MRIHTDNIQQSIPHVQGAFTHTHPECRLTETRSCQSFSCLYDKCLSNCLLVCCELDDIYAIGSAEGNLTVASLQLMFDSANQHDHISST